MPAVAYRSIKEAPVQGTVSKAVIRRAVRDLIELRKTDPKQYQARIKKAGVKPVRLVVP